MLYGLYLSAAGVNASAHRQDVIANNLANAETTGFKRDLSLFQQRLTEAEEGRGSADWTSDLLEGLGGGLTISGTLVDASQGEFEPTGGNLDLAVEGEGYFLVQNSAGQQQLTRNGQFLLDREGFLIVGDGSGHRVLDSERKPIRLDPRLRAQTAVSKDGQISQAGAAAARIGLFATPDPSKLTKAGGTLLNYPDPAALVPANGQIRSEFLERANLDPATELAALMEAQRHLEANANMIRYQDQTLGRLVNEVGKIG